MARRRGSRGPRAGYSSSKATRGSSHVRINLALWQRSSNEYDRRHRAVLGGARSMAWGVWRIPERELQALGDPRGRDILELGCGAARWSVALASRGARAVGLDLTPAQLAHARRVVRRSRQPVHLVRGNAEELPFRSDSFDLVFCDWGAMTFCDPHRTVPQVARVLRPGGRFVFSTSSPFRSVAQDRKTDRLRKELLYDYFGLGRIQYPDGEVNFQLTYGDWIHLFSRSGLVVQALTETRPGPTDRSSYLSARATQWARHWPLESIWQVQKLES